MKKIVNGFALLLMFVLTACENDIELAGEYEELPIIYGLLDASSDTQFVRINKTFLKPGENALESAKDPNNIYYDSLSVSLIDLSNDQSVILNRIEKPKEAGVFSTEKNFLYYSTMTMQVGTNYRLEALLPNGKVAYGETQVINNVTLDRPGSGSIVNFIKTTGLVDEYKFRVDFTADIARFDLKMFFVYEEVNNGNYTTHRVEVPIGTVNNDRLVRETGYVVAFKTSAFFNALDRYVPNNTTRREISSDGNLIVEAYAGDETLMFYKNVNEPISGISQTRPEFTNVENGLGVIASTSKSRIVASFAAETIKYLACFSKVKNRGWVYELTPADNCN